MKRTAFIISLLTLLAVNVYGQLQEDLALKYLVQLPAEKTKNTPVIILLHGYGSDEKDLFGLANYFPKNYLVIAARAPYTVAGGGYQWYEATKTNGHSDGKKEEVDNSREQIIKFIGQAVKKYKADAKAVYLVGFSQGAIMSYEVGLSDPAAVKGIGVLSGMLFNSLKPMVKTVPALKQLKIFIAHGTEDPRIAFGEAKAANEYLKSAGLKPEFHQYDGMGHQINNDVLKDLLQWLK